MPDHRTIADFRKNNGKSIGEVCRRLERFTQAVVATDGSKKKRLFTEDDFVYEPGRDQYRWSRR